MTGAQTSTVASSAVPDDQCGLFGVANACGGDRRCGKPGEQQALRAADPE